jgi:hypothetical protein
MNLILKTIIVVKDAPTIGAITDIDGIFFLNEKISCPINQNQ